MARLLGVVLLACTTQVCAVGMSGINVTSALGQQLKAEIGLVSVSRDEKDSLIARLATPDAYKNAGLDYPYSNKFKFQLQSKADGELYVEVTSAQAVNDPFVSLLVELSWSSGKLLREFTFLLDPVGYKAEQPVTAPVQVIAPVLEAPLVVPPAIVAPSAPAAAGTMALAESAVPVAQEAPAPQEALATPAAETTVTPAPPAPPVAEAALAVEQPAAPVAEPALPAAPVAAASAPAPVEPVVKTKQPETLAVKRGSTLGQIAEQIRPGDVSLERMLVALYRANEEQFDGKNMNRIRAGKILRMPDPKSLEGLTQAEAKKEIRAQSGDWNAYRQKLASAAVASSQPQEAQQASSGKISSTVADKTPVAKETAKEVLKLSKGETPGDKAGATAAGKAMSAQEAKNAAQEDAIAKAKAEKEAQARAAALEKNVKDMKRLAELKIQAEGALAPASTPAPASAVTAASAPAAAEVPLIDQAMALADEVIAEPLYLGGAAAALLGLFGLSYMARRRKSAPAKPKAKPQDDAAATRRMTVPVAPSPETGDFTVALSPKAAAAVQPEVVDHLSEADLFLTFGRDVQAEEILKEALLKTPDNHQIHLKLLGIYANRKDTSSFATIARQLKESGDAEAWRQAAEQGRMLEPNNPLYGGTGTVEDADSATRQMKAAPAMPDFMLDAALSPSANKANVEKTMILSADDMAAAQSSAMDFDVTSTNQAAPELAAMDFDVTSTNAAAPELGAMDFDITSTNAAAPELGAMDFDITSTHSAAPELGAMDFDVTSSQPAAASDLPNLDGLVFDVTSTHPAMPSAEPEKAAADEGDMEFTLDFPTRESAPKAAKPVELNFEGISLDLDEPIQAASKEADAGNKDERWHEVATKLDLAKAYQEMGDESGAREILEEVQRDGDAEQREAAQALLGQLG